MYDILTKSGVPTSDWLEIAKKLELSNQVLAGLFLIAWKESDATKPSWWKLARALKVIGGDWYDRASKQAEINAGTYVNPILVTVKQSLIRCTSFAIARHDYLIWGEPERAPH